MADHEGSDYRMIEEGLHHEARVDESRRQVNAARERIAAQTGYFSTLTTIGVSSYAELTGVEVLLRQCPNWTGTLVVRNDVKAHELQQVKPFANQLKANYPSITLVTP